MEGHAQEQGSGRAGRCAASRWFCGVETVSRKVTRYGAIGDEIGSASDLSLSWPSAAKNGYGKIPKFLSSCGGVTEQNAGLAAASTEAKLVRQVLVQEERGVIQVLQALEGWWTPISGTFSVRGVQPFDVSGPHWKKSCLGPHVKYIVTCNHTKDLIMFYVNLRFCVGLCSKPSWALGWTPLINLPAQAQVLTGRRRGGLFPYPIIFLVFDKLRAPSIFLALVPSV